MLPHDQDSPGYYGTYPASYHTHARHYQTWPNWARPRPRDLPSYDYWLFDSRLLVKVHFDDEERFLGGEMIKDPAVIVQHSYWRDAAWHRAIRRDEFAADIP